MKANSLTYYLISLSLISLWACEAKNPRLNRVEGEVSGPKETFVEDLDLAFRDTVYVPIYSDIYSETKDVRFKLTATLSIRNTSLQDSIYIEDIDYYDSQGNKVRAYIDKNLLLGPMQSIEYVVEEDDTVGGTGANFLINWGANKQGLKPIFQGVMISTHGQQGVSFTTEGISIVRKTKPCAPTIHE